MTTIPAIHTSCKKCVFAIYDNITQIGCHLDYLNKYKDKNISILEAYDEQKEFYVIGDKKCPGYREDSWFKNANLSMEEKIIKIKQENSINYLIVINLKDIDPIDLHKIFNTISELSFKPSKIILIRHTDDNKKFPFATLKTSLDDLNIQWRIQTMIDKDALWGDILHGITVAGNHAYRFICGIKTYTEDLSKLIDKANSIIYNDLSTFNILSNKTRDMIIFPGSVYRYANFHGHDILNDEKAYQTI
jgi:hypothetical protein